MVLWEITLATAYFLGLKRTYRLALRLQRRVVPRRFQPFTRRRTRFAFDVVIKVQNKIAGTRLGSWLCRGKTAAAPPPPPPPLPPAEIPKPKIEKALPSGPVIPSFKLPFQPSKLIPPVSRRENRTSERLYSVVPVMERSPFNRRLLREDIAAFTGLARGARARLSFQA